MRVIEPYISITNLPPSDLVLPLLERAGRTCYRSEDRIAPGSAEKLVRALIATGHHTPLEHLSASVRFVCDRGVSHELVRHRLASFSQESTRYANYSKDKFGSEITVVRPLFWRKDSTAYWHWKHAMTEAETCYMHLLAAGARPQEARAVLPTSTKTEVFTTCNLREWRHIFSLRCAPASHPQIRQLMLPLLNEFQKRIPVVFDDLKEQLQCHINEFEEISPVEVRYE